MRPSRELMEFIFVMTCLAIAILVAIFFTTRESFAHPQMLLQCQKYIQHKQATLVKEGVLPNGLYSEAYDTNDDGVIDAETISVVEYVETSEGQLLYHHEQYPMYYAVDVNYDKWPDVIVMDIRRLGNCDDLRTLIDGSTTAGQQRILWFLETINSPGQKPYQGVMEGA